MSWVIQRMDRITCDCGYVEDVVVNDALGRGLEARAAYVKHQEVCPKFGSTYRLARELAVELDQAMADLGWSGTALAMGVHSYLGITDNVPEGVGA